MLWKVVLSLGAWLPMCSGGFIFFPGPVVGPHPPGSNREVHPALSTFRDASDPSIGADRVRSGRILGGQQPPRDEFSRDGHGDRPRFDGSFGEDVESSYSSIAGNGGSTDDPAFGLDNGQRVPFSFHGREPVAEVIPSPIRHQGSLFSQAEHELNALFRFGGDTPQFHRPAAEEGVTRVKQHQGGGRHPTKDIHVENIRLGQTGHDVTSSVDQTRLGIHQLLHSISGADDVSPALFREDTEHIHGELNSVLSPQTEDHSSYRPFQQVKKSLRTGRLLRYFSPSYSSDQSLEPVLLDQTSSNPSSEQGIQYSVGDISGVRTSIDLDSFGEQLDHSASRNPLDARLIDLLYAEGIVVDGSLKSHSVPPKPPHTLLRQEAQISDHLPQQVIRLRLVPEIVTLSDNSPVLTYSPSSVFYLPKREAVPSTPQDYRQAESYLVPEVVPIHLAGSYSNSELTASEQLNSVNNTTFTSLQHAEDVSAIGADVTSPADELSNSVLQPNIQVRQAPDQRDSAVAASSASLLFEQPAPFSTNTYFNNDIIGANTKALLDAGVPDSDASRAATEPASPLTSRDAASPARQPHQEPLAVEEVDDRPILRDVSMSHVASLGQHNDADSGQSMDLFDQDSELIGMIKNCPRLHQNLTLECRSRNVSRRSPIKRFWWVRRHFDHADSLVRDRLLAMNGQIFGDRDKIKVTQLGSGHQRLTVTAVTASDTGLYMCQTGWDDGVAEVEMLVFLCH